MSIRDDIIESIRLDLLRARWAPGEKLTIRALAAEHGTSEMPVREAIKALTERGLLESEANRSARVPRVSRQAFNEYYEIALELEGFAVEKAARRLTNEDIEALKAYDSNLRVALQTRNAPAYIQHFNAFLMKVYERAGSHALVEMIERAWTHTAPQAAVIFQTSEVIELLDRFHLRMLNALIKRDGAAARDALTAGLAQIQGMVNVMLDRPTMAPEDDQVSEIEGRP